MIEKRKEKIKKLLELSMSDNEHEASIALRQALSLMDKHNISKDDLSGQKMIQEFIVTPYISLPSWYTRIYSKMASLSGCMMYSDRGEESTDRYSRISLVGKERDVENAMYLSVFISREMEKSVVKYKKKIKGHTRTASMIRSYKIGFINAVYQRMYKSKTQFFNAQVGKRDLVCIDTETRIEDAERYLKQELNVSLISTRSKSSYIPSALDSGSNDADDLQINNAINKQKHILRIGEVS